MNEGHREPGTKLQLEPRSGTPLVLSCSFCFGNNQGSRGSLQNTQTKSQPTSSQKPLTHCVGDVKRQPLGGAPRGQILAADVALFGNVLVGPENLEGRERRKYPRPGQGRQPRSQCRSSGEGSNRKLKILEDSPSPLVNALSSPGQTQMQGVQEGRVHSQVC